MSARIPAVGESVHGISADDLLYLDPLFDRLEAIERRLELEARKPAEPPASQIPPTDLSRVYSQLETLRQDLPGMISVIVQQQLAVAPAPKSRLKPEVMEAAIRESVALAVDERFGSVEQGLGDHASSVAALNERVNQTDANLQRLVAVISRLIEEPGLNTAVQHTPRGAHAAASFEAHLSDAMHGEPVPPERAPREFEVGPNPEPEGAPRHPRLPMSRIL